MPHTDLLKTFGLSRNPFTDRTAETANLDPSALYLASDLRGFRPSDTTYVFFGRRGSGKTTIRLGMETGYRQYNSEAVSSGKSKGFYVVDICRPGHMTACLTNFQEAIGCTFDSWDASFSDQWRTSDLVDCILCYAATEFTKRATAVGEAATKMLADLRSDPKASRQFLLLSHLYAATDTASLAALRSALTKPKYSAAQVTVGVGIGLTTVAGVVVAAQDETISGAVSQHVGAAASKVADNVPLLNTHPRLVGAAAATLTAAGIYTYLRSQRMYSMGRAQSLQEQVRVVRRHSTETLAQLVNSLFTSHDTADAVRQLCIGVSAHQKLELLNSLVRLLGYEGLAIFGDCFDEVTLLDPVRFPAAIKAFAREVCRNDVLNFGRLHFFFPDSRLSLDLNTDRTLKEARFDRHFVRDLTWSRHQLEELAERRFRAAQQTLREETAAMNNEKYDPALDNVLDKTSFADLFKKVRGEDFSSYISKLSTPRELLIMMTEMFARIEANPEGGLTAQDMEIAVTKAIEQSV